MSPSRLSDCRILYLYSRLKPRGDASDTLFAGGAQKRTFQMAVHFAGLCAGVWLGSDDDPHGRVIRELERRNVGHLYLPFRSGRWRTPTACARVLRFVHENRIDVIHCNDRWTALFGCLARRTAGVAYVYSARNVFQDKRCSRWFWGHNIVAVSQAVRDNLTGFFRVPPDRVTVIYNGTDIQSSSMEDRAALRARLGLDPDTLVVSVIGRLSEQKGHAVLLEALAKVAPSCPALRILLVGDGERRDALQRQARQAGLEDQVCFCGFQDNVAAFIDISLFTIMPSLWEGMPGGVIESLALGKPVVATPAGGTGEIVQDGVNGLLVPCGDSTRLAEAILTMLENPARLRTMGANAKALSGRQFTLDAMLSSYGEYYSRLLFAQAPAENRDLPARGRRHRRSESPREREAPGPGLREIPGRRVTPLLTGIRTAIRRVAISLRRWGLVYAYGMDIAPSARISWGTKLDKTYPQGIHIGAESYCASGCFILAHDYARGLHTDTRIGRRCFIGVNAIVMPGVAIGDGAIVGAGAVVTQTVPAGCVVAGNPARIVRREVQTTRFGRLVDERAPQETSL